MRTGHIFLIAVVFTLGACTASSSTTGNDRKEAKKEQAAADFEKTAMLIDSGDYQFTIRSASPSGGKTVQITSLYTLVAKDGKIAAYLPYYGRAYSGGYGDNGAIEFNGEPESLEITKNQDKNKIRVEFSIRSERDLYEVHLETAASGYGNLVISSDKRQTISYNGLLSEITD